FARVGLNDFKVRFVIFEGDFGGSDGGIEAGFRRVGAGDTAITNFEISRTNRDLGITIGIAEKGIYSGGIERAIGGIIAGGEEKREKEGGESERADNHRHRLR